MLPDDSYGSSKCVRMLHAQPLSSHLQVYNNSTGSPKSVSVLAENNTLLATLLTDSGFVESNLKHSINGGY